MYLGARHPELFGACGTMSGVMDLRPFTDKYDLTRRFGPWEKFPERWLEHSVLTQAEKFAGKSTGILIECGLEDSAFIDGNQELHRKLIELKVPHDYIERPGGHSWGYWLNALPYHLQFMTDRLKPVGKAG
jgi:S-formylglutathione hydrolase FrmB